VHAPSRPDPLVGLAVLVGSAFLVVACLAVRGTPGGRHPVTSPASPDPGGTSTAGLAQTVLFGQGWTRRTGGSFGLGNIEVVHDPSGPFPTFLRVHYPAGSASPTVTVNHRAPVGGAQLYLYRRGIAPTDAADLRYDVRFPVGFDFVKGGKLPGLFGGRVNNGRHIPDGTNGLSTRYMWRAGGDGEVYAYLPTSKEHGTSLGRGNWRFTPGTWHRIEQRVELNHPGRADGRVQVWFDGRQVLDEHGLEFRTVADLQIDGLFFSTFFGGSDPSWASTAATHVDFAGFDLRGVTSSN
jgi:hypothetical protein